MAFDARAAARALTGSMDTQAFDADVREKRAAIFAHTMDSEMVSEVFSLQRLESSLASEAIPLANVDVFDDGQLTRLVDMQYKSGKTGLEVMASRVSGGSTIRVRDIDRFEARLGSFAVEIQRQFAARAQINLYLTPPAKTGFAPHFDITDVFVLQCLGAKHWRLFEDYSNRIDLPVMETNWDPERFKPLSVPEAVKLSAGDVLYMPRGVMHQAFCTEQESVHLTISLVPLTVSDLIARELQRLSVDHLAFRQRVPWSLEEGGYEEATELVRSCLGELSRSLDVAVSLGAERAALAAPVVKEQPANQLSQALQTLREKSQSVA